MPCFEGHYALVFLPFCGNSLLCCTLFNWDWKVHLLVQHGKVEWELWTSSIKVTDPPVNAKAPSAHKWPEIWNFRFSALHFCSEFTSLTYCGTVALRSNALLSDTSRPLCPAARIQHDIGTSKEFHWVFPLLHWKQQAPDHNHKLEQNRTFELHCLFHLHAHRLCYITAYLLDKDSSTPRHVANGAVRGTTVAFTAKVTWVGLPETMDRYVLLSVTITAHIYLFGADTHQKLSISIDGLCLVKRAG